MNNSKTRFTAISNYLSRKIKEILLLHIFYCNFAISLINNKKDMKLTDLLNGNKSGAQWEAKGYELPKFDIKALREKTAKEPTWVHFGGGNIFRAFPAAILNDALNTGKYDRGVIVAETFDFEVIDKAYSA